MEGAEGNFAEGIRRKIRVREISNLPHSFQEPLLHLNCGSFGKGQNQDFRGWDLLLQNQKENPLHQHECLAASRACDHLARPTEMADCLLLVRIPPDLQTSTLQMIAIKFILSGRSQCSSPSSDSDEAVDERFTKTAVCGKLPGANYFSSF